MYSNLKKIESIRAIIVKLLPLFVGLMLIHNPVTHFPITFLVIAGYILLYTWLRGSNFKSLGFVGFSKKDWFRVIIAFLLLETSMDFLIQPLLTRLMNEPADYSSFQFLQNNINAYLKWMLYMWFSAAFGEELLFRSFVFERLQSVALGKKAIVLVSAFIFSLPHIYQGITGLLSTFLFGLFFGMLYTRYQNIWINILVHGLIDSLFITLSYTGTLQFYTI